MQSHLTERFVPAPGNSRLRYRGIEPNLKAFTRLSFKPVLTVYAGFRSSGWRPTRRSSSPTPKRDRAPAVLDRTRPETTRDRLPHLPASAPRQSVSGDTGWRIFQSPMRDPWILIKPLRLRAKRIWRSLGTIRHEIRSGRRVPRHALPSVAGSTFTPGPIVDDMATRWRYVPLAPAGFARVTASTKALMFSTSFVSWNETFPTLP